MKRKWLKALTSTVGVAIIVALVFALLPPGVSVRVTGGYMSLGLGLAQAQGGGGGSTPYSLSFDGIDNYVDVGNLTDFGANLGNGTIEFWTKKDGASASGALWGSANTDWKTVFILYAGELIGGDGLLLEVYDNDWKGFTASVYTSGELPDIFDNEWHHIAVVYQLATDSVTFYVNGTAYVPTIDVYSSGPSNFSDFENTFTIGASHDEGQIKDFWDGKLSDVRIWTTIRTEQQINANKDRRLTGNEGGLFAYWKLDEGTGTSTADATGNGHTGTIEGASWYNDDFWAGPRFPLSDGNCTFTVTNNSNAAVNVNIKVSPFSGGAGWTIGNTTGPDRARVIVWKTGDYEGDGLILTTEDQLFISDLTGNTTAYWELRLDTPTSATGIFPDGIAKNSTITLTAVLPRRRRRVWRFQLSKFTRKEVIQDEKARSKGNVAEVQGSVGRPDGIGFARCAIR